MHITYVYMCVSVFAGVYSHVTYIMCTFILERH